MLVVEVSHESLQHDRTAKQRRERRHRRRRARFVLAARLSALRRIFTPTVAGTVVMLIPVTLAPVILGKLADVPEGASPAAAPVTVSVTLLIIVVTALRGSGLWRLSAMLGSAITVGGLTVIGLTLFEELTGPRRRRLRVALGVDAYPKIDAFLGQFGARRRWSAEMIERVRAVGEETLLLLIRREAERAAGDGRRLLLVAGGERDAALLEFIAATDETNLEDQMALLGERAVGGRMEQEVSLRLLRHYASSVRHHQYHDTDVITVRVEPTSPTLATRTPRNRAATRLPRTAGRPPCRSWERHATPG